MRIASARGKRFLENLYAYSQRKRHDDSLEIVMRIAVPRVMIRMIRDSLILVIR